jgi:GSH-dependent disulfide-bond oxidoreductase
MLTLHTWPTPNGKKIFIMLEELGISYQTHFVDIDKDEQFQPDFLAISPNNKIPALVDHDADGGSLSIFESGAILTYLADKQGKFLAPSGHARWTAHSWLYWQVGGLGPMMGQVGFFALRSKEKVPLAIDRFVAELGRLFGVLERRLATSPYLAGEEYSIADIACYPWMVGAMTRAKPVLAEHLENKPAIDRWMKAVAARPAVQQAMAIEPPQGG